MHLKQNCNPTYSDPYDIEWESTYVWPFLIENSTNSSIKNHPLILSYAKHDYIEALKQTKTVFQKSKTGDKVNQF